MALIGVERVRYGVEDVDLCTRYFDDFGLVLERRDNRMSVFRLPEGSRVEILPQDAPELAPTAMVGPGVREVVWGVDSEESLEALVEDLSRDLMVTEQNGEWKFTPPFGIPMALTVFRPKPVHSAPDPLNAPGFVQRINTHRKWRKRARPKVIQHVVFQAPQPEKASAWMCQRLGFRISDVQTGFGHYLRCDGAINHHNFLMLDANAHIPGMDGQVRFHHVNFGVEDVDEIMIGANHMTRKGWDPSHVGLGRHRIDSALFFYLPCPAGGEAEYGTDADYIDDGWVPRRWINPLFGYSHFTQNVPPFLMQEPEWAFEFVDEDTALAELTASAT